MKIKDKEVTDIIDETIKFHLDEIDKQTNQIYAELLNNPEYRLSPEAFCRIQHLLIRWQRKKSRRHKLCFIGTFIAAILLVMLTAIKVNAIRINLGNWFQC